jgi:lipopolysaccharide export system protein LptA
MSQLYLVKVIMKNYHKENTFLFVFSNEQRISPSFRRDYFGLNFGFKSPIYVDIMRVFKVKSKGKRSRLNDGVIFYSLFKWVATAFMLLMSVSGYGQTKINVTENDSTGKKEVRIIFSDLLENEEDSLGNRITKLSGGVELQQDSVLMYCDTAFKKENDIVAYGNVAIKQNDSLTIFSDSLVYRGETKIADLFGNVIMENKDKRLFTSYLNYELDPKIARYTTGALITHGDTKLISKRGTYYVNTDEMFFKDSITVFDSTFTLRADTLLFNTETQVVTFLGPTLIQKDSTHIYCEDGFYDMDTQYAEFEENAQFLRGAQQATANTIIYDGSMNEIRLEGDAQFEENDKLATADLIRYEEDSENIHLEGNAYFRDSIQEIKTPETITYNSETASFSSTGRSKVVDEKQLLEADKLTFDDATGMGLAEGNVYWQDTIEDISIKAEMAAYNKETDYIKATGKRPLLASMVDKDTLYLASDTLVSTRLNEQDSSRLMQAYEDVRIFKTDMQAVADSLAFISKDSLFKLFKNPVLWSDTSQFKGDSIFIQMKGGAIDRIYLHNNAFVITSSDLKFFNQIKGKTITAFFEENKLDRVRVEGNAEALYYALDENKAYIGVTKTICSEMVLFFKEENVKNIKFYKQPSSKVTPMQQVLKSPPQLDGFSWDFAIRPKSIADLRNERLKMKRKRSASPAAINNPDKIDGFQKPSQVKKDVLNSKKRPKKGGK